MMTGLPLAFTAPFVLIGLLALPLLWWLLRMTPPQPKSTIFPPLRLLKEIEQQEETPARTPWWLLLLRLGLLAFLIVGLAGPVFDPGVRIPMGNGPLYLLIDNGYAAAPDWQARVASAENLLAQARAAKRDVLLVATADGPREDAALIPAAQAQEYLASLEPRSWSPDHAALKGLLGRLEGAASGEIIWIAEPADDGSGAAFAQMLAALSATHSLVVMGADSPPPPGLIAVLHDSEGLAADVRRLDPGTASEARLRALDRRGSILDEVVFRYENDQAETRVRFDLPLALRNDIARLEIVGAQSASGVHLLDDRWRRRSVGLISSAIDERAQPLLSPSYYITRALSPFADVRERKNATVEAMLHAYREDKVAAIIMADVGTLTEPAAREAALFMEEGGVLIRFAGPRLAQGEDRLVPTPLRHGGRTLGGSLSWDQPQALGAFSEGSPLAGIALPGDVTVSRQVLAEPGADLPARTWASLTDGTPLVTGVRRGAGFLVLFHVTADTRWSNLPLSGTFVDMLRRMVMLGQASPMQRTGKNADRLLPPLRILDGAGRFVLPPPHVKGMTEAKAVGAEPSRETPAGLYGAEEGFYVVNPLQGEESFQRLDLSALQDKAAFFPLDRDRTLLLEGWVLGCALLLMLLDGLIMLFMLGALSGRGLRRSRALGLLLLGLVSLPATLARAEGLSPEDQKILEAATITRLAYVVTGNAEIDETSYLGLKTLSRFLASRTALEPGDPIGIDPATDELSVFPLIYWPVTASAPLPEAATMGRIDAFMRSGGTVLFDTRDALAFSFGSAGGTAEGERLRSMLATLDIPPLEPVPSDHVLTKAFYLLSDFPGRIEGGALWVEASMGEQASPEADFAPTPGEGRPVRAGDGVSPILIAGNDFAGAWAADEGGNFLYPLVPGTPRQREFALRAGVNIVIYALTGNYKADQVHVPALLERLGQ